MYLSDFDLQQLDEQKLKELAAKQKDSLLVKLLWDLGDFLIFLYLCVRYLE